jgi:hypothetical protein
VRRQRAGARDRARARVRRASDLCATRGRRADTGRRGQKCGSTEAHGSVRSA